MIRGLDHTEPLTADIPGVRRQPAEVVRVAYWYGVRLHNYGWRLRSIRYLALGRDWCSAEVALETPTHRATAYRADKTTTATDLPGMFAAAVREVGISGGQRAMDRLLERLDPMLGEHLDPAVRHIWLHYSADQIVWWAAHQLIDENGWLLSEFGSDIARGGFIAAIPGDTIAVYPAGMADDGTYAGALARAIGRLSADQVAFVGHQLGAYQQQIRQAPTASGERRAGPGR
ncbi:hypothetical protein [Mycolicibacterium fortuitum]|uniref:Uncharacterized protein n=1 Tax=Mycolicibacterium fortuitum TaxID=1766 RepID=A0AAE5AE03_MYCFO|nr:hypothetical protein [Mycolicibacterium fortuitum]MDV7193349.1 hypothetical protein [Mycolicibacterium fortuitum]MDV7205970.1 hypothetical protein [Mycolicibacterium fortuitum]MDV7227383.1 hypothetical protein [Mycolicibacterium fortuitum]MDV7259920.1 hypothetical protein [Mycolicibacterium fortuitum]MDV7287576.1 hypothetical protein [Mycolicibacterium fortuitum]